MKTTATPASSTAGNVQLKSEIPSELREWVRLVASASGLTPSEVVSAVIQSRMPTQ